MKDQSIRVLAWLAAVIAGLLCFDSAHAVPAFARQMKVPCTACHYQHFPLLNSFGRAFKSSGFTMTDRQLIEDSNRISIPENLNVALFTNLRYQSSNGDKPQPADSPARNSNNGEWIIPGETSLFVSGRISPNMAALLEGDVRGAGTQPGSGFLASLKLPFVYETGKADITLGLVPFSAGLGPAYAFELLNTGAVGNQLITLVHPAAISAQQYVQVGPATGGYGGDAEGVAAMAVNGIFFVTLAKWSPNHLPIDTGGTSSGLSSDYARAALMPQVGNWDLGFGIQYFGGRSSVAGGGTLTDLRTKAYAVDAQAQGAIGNIPLGVYLSYATAPGTSAGDPVANLYDRNPNRVRAGSIALELGVFRNDSGTVQLAYRRADNGAASNNKDNAVTAGLTYLPWYNVQLSLLQTWYSGNAHSSGNPNNVIDASGSGTRLTSLNVAVGF